MATDHPMLRQVTKPQRAAIDAILSGASHAEAADAAGVNHATVTAWYTHHPGFQGALNQRRVEQAEQRDAVLHQLDELALEAVANQLLSGDPGFALKWLTLRGHDATHPSRPGPTDPNQIVEQLVADRAEQTKKQQTEATIDQIAGIDRDQLRADTKAHLATQLGTTQADA